MRHTKPRGLDLVPSFHGMYGFHIGKQPGGRGLWSEDLLRQYLQSLMTSFTFSAGPAANSWRLLAGLPGAGRPSDGATDEGGIANSARRNQRTNHNSVKRRHVGVGTSETWTKLSQTGSRELPWRQRCSTHFMADSHSSICVLKWSPTFNIPCSSMNCSQEAKRYEALMSYGARMDNGTSFFVSLRYDPCSPCIELNLRTCQRVLCRFVGILQSCCIYLFCFCRQQACLELCVMFYLIPKCNQLKVHTAHLWLAHDNWSLWKVMVKVSVAVEVWCEHS